MRPNRPGHPPGRSGRMQPYTFSGVFPRQASSMRSAQARCTLRCHSAPSPLPSRTNWTRLIPPPVLNGHVLSGARCTRRCHSAPSPLLPPALLAIAPLPRPEGLLHPHGVAGAHFQIDVKSVCNFSDRGLAQVKLGEARHSAALAGLGRPSAFRAAVACDVLGRLGKVGSARAHARPTRRRGGAAGGVRRGVVKIARGCHRCWGASRV